MGVYTPPTPHGMNAYDRSHEILICKHVTRIRKHPNKLSPRKRNLPNKLMHP